MMKLFATAILLLAAASIQAQTANQAPPNIPSGVPVKPGSKATAITPKAELDPGFLTEKTYTNRGFGFEIAFPGSWVIPGIDSEKYWQEKGYDLRPKINRNDPQQAANAGVSPDEFAQKQATLWKDGLAGWGLEVARAAGVPGYVVFDNKTLRAVSAARPASGAELLAIPGVGPVKLDRYGAALLELIGSHSP